MADIKLAVLVQNTYRAWGETVERPHFDSSEPLDVAGVLDRMAYHVAGGYDKPIKVREYRDDNVASQAFARALQSLKSI